MISQLCIFAYIQTYAHSKVKQTMQYFSTFHTASSIVSLVFRVFNDIVVYTRTDIIYTRVATKQCVDMNILPLMYHDTVIYNA